MCWWIFELLVLHSSYINIMFVKERTTVASFIYEVNTVQHNAPHKKFTLIFFKAIFP